MENAKDKFAALFALAQPGLQRFVRSSVYSAHEAEDIIQEVAIVIWDKFNEYKPGTSFQAWAIQIAKYKILHLRRAHARNKVLLNETLMDQAAQFYAEASYEEVELRQDALEECLSKLPEKHRHMMSLRYQKDHSCINIAKLLQRKVGQVRTQLSRVRGALRKCIEGKLTEEASIG